jgi:hypothetical protein
MNCLQINITVNFHKFKQAQKSTDRQRHLSYGEPPYRDGIDISVEDNEKYMFNA